MWRTLTIGTLLGLMFTGCVGSGTHEQTLAELDKTKKELESLKKQSADLKKQLEVDQEELTRAKKALDATTANSLEAQAAAGGVSVDQRQDQTTITVIDRVLFDSGQDSISPGGIKILDRVSEILKDANDKRVRIEGHADSRPIGENLRDKFSTNWELSTARATNVVHYLEQSGIDRALLSAAGYADTKPVAENETREGRAANRRIEITLYPKDLSEVAK